ncbi:high-affinity branched-chain amino acid ABC transporter, permease protein [Campylobacter lari]|uniref:Branched-chain amino acid ABC transporter permease n=2 Tax=Campylobacter lari TaxID=201 RepID=A0A5L4JUG4_CAMLA|nr:MULTISPECIES: branched-chain amino acid ABC transporter permease [Campylobacter]MCR8705920.1 branched-chain amino acid ABC transporter permease [Campylobacter sp. 2352 PW]MCR8707381.1 branched-chain amino acid ABC transporter permease [Campylobacter sp. W0066.2]MCR8712954.1 branched-chain amino acid ABC transporter permease [Campylobacter sp. W0066.1]AJD03637.1 high-affinity branched-chain amino acid transporter, permease protein [Campylobacter lari CCUG 22395]AKJ53842.1 branched-chain amin
MDSSLILQQIINGFSLGSMYALIAIGYTMVYGVLRLINFAHGDIMMVGAYSALFCVTSMNVPFLGALSLAMLFAAALGIAIDRVAYKPLRKAPRISLLITAIGISFLIQNVFNVLFGSTPKYFPVPSYLETVINFNNISISINSILVPILTFFILLVVLFILYKSKYGIAIRALAFDIHTVNLMGIDANRIIAIVFALGSALAAIGGIFWAVSYPSVEPSMGTLIGLKAFGAAVLGGIGSVAGAVLGGLIIGFTEVVVVAIFPDLSGFKDAFAFIFLVLILLFKPTGILGINFEKSRF